MYCIRTQWIKYTVYYAGSGSCFSLITHKVHPVFSQPVEALEEEQECEEGDEARGEVVPEHSECQARLGHSVPGALNQMLNVYKQRRLLNTLLSFTTETITYESKCWSR